MLAYKGIAPQVAIPGESPENLGDFILETAQAGKRQVSMRLTGCD